MTQKTEGLPEIGTHNLGWGKHSPVEGSGCIMEWAGVFWYTTHGWSFQDAWRHLSDSPVCTADCVTVLAQLVNDGLGPEERLRLIPFIPRLATAHGTLDVHAERNINREFVLALVREVMSNEAVKRHLEQDGTDAMWERRIESVGDAPLHITGDWAIEALALGLREGTMDPVALLDHMLDSFEKIRAEEGVLGEDPPIPPSLEELERAEMDLAEFAESWITNDVPSPV